MGNKKSATGKKTTRKTPKRSDGKSASPKDESTTGCESLSEQGERNDSGSGGFPIVGIGASAGGLEAMEKFLHGLLPEMGMGFVIVTHQRAGHVSLLPEILSKATNLTVVPITNGMKVQAGRIHVSPPGVQVTLHQGRLHCAENTTNLAQHLPIDEFLRSLAADQGKQAICVILSGTGTDGTLGVKAIKAAAGMAMAEDPQVAAYSGMPNSAIATGLVDYVLPPEEMPAQLLAYVEGSSIAGSEAVIVPLEPLKEIFQLIRSRTGNDFSNYKGNTVHRRIERRMSVHQIKAPSGYVRFLSENPAEIDLLFKELLISVTSFFRDEAAFESLAAGPLTERLESLEEGGKFRAWIPGCATGEEVYSLGILLAECMDRVKRQFDVQIFGTDLDSEAIDTARRGCYPDGVTADISTERLKHWFVHENSKYCVRKKLREMTVFAPQNVIHDPPFTRLDFLSCRNLMIYLDADLQKRLIPMFHYALKPGGILFLGPSETVNDFSSLFEVIDKKWKIYRRKETDANSGRLPQFSIKTPVIANRADNMNMIQSMPERQTGLAIVRLLLERFCPASVVVNEHGEIVYLSGRTGDYLEPATGRPRMNVLEMASKGLRTELGAALRRATSSDADIGVVHASVRVLSNGDFTRVNVSVTRILEPVTLRGLYLITFSPTEADSEVSATSSPPADHETAAPVGDNAVLELELRHTQESLQATIEELETSNEELSSANEELQSTNEEMQSSNEELETAREELQSLNEEMTTVNNEMESKIEALANANDDLENLLNSTEIATLYLDGDLNIKRFTQRTSGIFNLIPSDIGRPLGDLASSLCYDQLDADCRRAIETLKSSEAEVVSQDGHWYLMRIMPYRKAENLIDGVVLTLVNIDKIKKSRKQRDYYEAIVETVREPLVILDKEFKVVSCNRAFYETFKTRSKPTEGESLFEIGGDKWEIPQLRSALEKVIETNKKIENFRVEAVFPRIGSRVFMLNARQIPMEVGIAPLILLAMEPAEKES
jgi:two-component system CheB/CheR fusion protein